ncbi:AbrB/MazE/SpoVT family DNA-binding domain-containing protein [Pseudomonas sp. RIT-To-2]|uniref:AbrB/MazE/SpoVT family DNA-binding domain-containing protein n=1 Tax=Pseudomonas sp. RIT-To-2 TaxID=3462541 RepID=UPI002413B91E
MQPVGQMMNVQVTVACIDPRDGSGDIVIELPAEVMAALNLECEDALNVEHIECRLVLTAVRSESL